MKKKRAKRNNYIAIRLNDNELKYLDLFCQKTGLTRSEFMRNYLTKQIERFVDINTKKGGK